MTDKELRSLNRVQLLEILIKLSEENEELKKEVDALTKKLNDRKIALEQAGSIAEAALSLNGVFESAQAAARQYLDNIEIINSECAAAKAKAEAEAVELIAEAQQAARQIIKNAKEKADKSNDKKSRKSESRKNSGKTSRETSAKLTEDKKA